jgi:serine/threonine protein phosphatase 1
MRRLGQRSPDWRPSTGGRLVYAVGDIHGCYDLLYRLLVEIEDDLSRAKPLEPPIFVFLGDYIDRGPDSRRVVQTLAAIQTKSSIDARFIRGNHEQAMLDFLDGVDNADAWLFYGGLETLASYGARPAIASPADVVAADVREEFRRRLPRKHEMFLRDTVLMVEVGDYGFVHAGVRPGIALDAQAADDLMWIRDEFLRSKLPSERVIVHGHTPVESPYFDHRRIALDTGAYLTGVLSAARLFGTEQSIIQATTVTSGAKRARFGAWSARDGDVAAPRRAEAVAAAPTIGPSGRGIECG